MMEPDQGKLFEATCLMLQRHLAQSTYPTPEDNADLAACLSHAFMAGAAFIAQAAGMTPELWLSKGNEILRARGRARSPLILPPGVTRQ